MPRSLSGALCAASGSSAAEVAQSGRLKHWGLCCQSSQWSGSGRVSSQWYPRCHPEVRQAKAGIPERCTAAWKGPHRLYGLQPLRQRIVGVGDAGLILTTGRGSGVSRNHCIGASVDARLSRVRVGTSTRVALGRSWCRRLYACLRRLKTIQMENI